MSLIGNRKSDKIVIPAGCASLSYPSAFIGYPAPFFQNTEYARILYKFLQNASEVRFVLLNQYVVMVDLKSRVIKQAENSFF